MERAMQVLAASCVLMVSCSGGDNDATEAPRVIQAGAPGETNRVLTDDEVDAIEPLPEQLADVEFMRGMIHHHAQALVMTGYAATNSGGDQVPLLARRMEIGQTDEIALMTSWLLDRGWDAPSGDLDEHLEHDDSELMPGMLTDAELAALGDTRGDEFDRLFLESMIRHHEGALAMVDELYAAGGGQHVDVGRFADDVYADQSIEIGRMRELLAELG